MDKLPNTCRCGQEPVVWLHDGIVLIQCQDPHCRHIEIVGQQTHQMAVTVWDEHQAQAAELVRLTAELDAMTERKDGWRRVAREYWWLVSEDTMRRQSIIRRDRRRLEARNGHTD